jgi:3-oxoadipate enol-lactonase
VTNSIVVDGLRLAYRLDGSAGAPTLVFSNSLGTDWRMWDGQVAALGAHFRIVRYDTRGHGQSGVPEEPATLDQLGSDLLALLDHLQIAQAALCGLSLGGLTALWLAAYHPARVGRAVFANTAARIGTVESWSTRIAAVRAGGMEAVREAVVGRFLHAEFRRQHPEVTDAISAMLTSTPPAGYIAACAALRDADLRAVVPSIRVPSLIIAGALDESTPPAGAVALHAAIAGSELVLLPAAHLSNIEQAELFNACLRRFLTADGCFTS